jgi:hypothetical protein
VVQDSFGPRSSLASQVSIVAVVCIGAERTPEPQQAS